MAELKHRMSAAEFGRWIGYRKRNGPMDDMRLHDRPAAMLAMVVNRAIGGKADLYDFMPYAKKPDAPPPVVKKITDLASVFGSIKA